MVASVRRRTDVVLRGGLVVDGTGAPGRIADVAVADGRIASAAGRLDLRDVPAVDATGLVVAPGFVDVHSHSDLSILGHPAGTGKVLQGVTTEVVGNCGLSVAPVSTIEVGAALRVGMTFCDDPAVPWDWTSVAEYRSRVLDADTGPSIEILAGHNAIRASVVGFGERAADDGELDRMGGMLDEALSDGAVGMSLGLMYPPSSYADERELVALGGVLRRHDALLASHMADYSSGLLDSVAAMIRVGEQSGCRVQLSHLVAVGRENWGTVARALELVDAAVERGVDVAADFYPYLAGSTNLSQVLPGWAMSGGLEAMRERLDDPRDRDRIRAHIGAQEWSDFLLVSTPSDPGLDGMRITEAAARRSVDADDLVLSLLARSDPTVIVFGRSEEDLRAVMTHPRSMLGSDGVAVDLDGSVGGRVPHPRFFGAFPALFGEYVRDEPVLSLEDAVRKCTSASADRVRLADRGRIAPGLRADLVVFDPSAIGQRSTYEASRRAPEGIRLVMREGLVLARDGELAR